MKLDELKSFVEGAGMTLAESECRSAHVFSKGGVRITSVQKGHVEKLSTAELAQLLDEHTNKTHERTAETKVGGAKELAEDHGRDVTDGGRDR